MSLFFAGHQEKYAVEQTLLTLFPRAASPIQTPQGATNWCSPGEASGAPPGRCCRGRPTSASARWLPPNAAEDPVVSTRLTRGPPAAFTWRGGLPGDRASLGMPQGFPVKLPPGPWRPEASPPGRGHAADQHRVSPARQLAMDCAQASLAVKRDLKPQEISCMWAFPLSHPVRLRSFISRLGSANWLIPDYLDALLAEIDAAAPGGRGRPSVGLFGTPPPWSPQLAE
ncbi:MAG: hypothetical protein ACLS43_04545 [Evtepia gabavorous]